MSHVFRRYAEEAQEMARSSRRAEDKQYWTGPGERWMRCAENAEHAEARTRPHAAKTRRKRDVISLSGNGRPLDTFTAARNAIIGEPRWFAAAPRPMAIPKPGLGHRSAWHGRLSPPCCVSRRT